MSDSGQANDSRDTSSPQDGILAALPRTRPQRASPRRAAARSVAEAKVAEAGKTEAKQGKPAQAKRSKPKSASTRAHGGPPRARRTKPGTTRGPSSRDEPAPRQGYEPEDEVERGATVNPPSSAELAESVADIFGELAGAGLSAAGRLLKDALAPLRRP
jgi:hypothetical protein